MTTFIVPNNKYPTIQSAINAANSGDEIRILPGRYNEYLSIFAKNNLTVCCSNYNGRYILTDQVVLENCGNEGIGLNIDADNKSPSLIINVVLVSPSVIGWPKAPTVSVPSW